MKRLSLLSCLLFFAAVLVASSAAALVGGWTPIKNLKDKHVVEIAEYAVTEYDKRSKADLKLEKIVKGETQVVAGTNYRLVLVVKGGEKYKAVVWEKPWLKFRNLTSFEPVKA